MHQINLSLALLIFFFIFCSKNESPTGINSEVSPDPLKILSVGISKITESTCEATWITNYKTKGEFLFSSSSDSTSFSFSKADTVPCDTHVLAINNLLPETEYLYKINVNLNDSVEMTSGPGLFKTLRDSIAPVISAINSAVVDTNTFLIEWNTNELSQCYMKYGEIKSNLLRRVEESAFLFDHYIKISSLKDTTYYFKIVATDKYGNAKESNLDSFSVNIPDTIFTVKEGQVTGICKYEGTSIVLEKVRISIGTSFTYTDSNGYFKLTNIPQGKSSILLSRSGLEDVNISIQVADSSFCTFTMRGAVDQQSITGYVRNSLGHPIRDAFVSISDLHDTTDAEGRFQLPSIFLDHFTVNIKAMYFRNTSRTFYLYNDDKQLNFQLTADTINIVKNVLLSQITRNIVKVEWSVSEANNPIFNQFRIYRVCSNAEKDSCLKNLTYRQSYLLDTTLSQYFIDSSIQPKSDYYYLVSSINIDKVESLDTVLNDSNFIRTAGAWFVFNQPKSINWGIDSIKRISGWTGKYLVVYSEDKNMASYSYFDPFNNDIIKSFNLLNYNLNGQYLFKYDYSEHVFINDQLYVFGGNPIDDKIRMIQFGPAGSGLGFNTNSTESPLAAVNKGDSIYFIDWGNFYIYDTKLIKLDTTIQRYHLAPDLGAENIYCAYYYNNQIFAITNNCVAILENFTWRKVCDMPKTIVCKGDYYHVKCVVETDKVYIIVNNDCWRYNMQTNTFSPIESISIQQYDFANFVWFNKDNRVFGYNFSLGDRYWEYDPNYE
jgi:hypothetical protein